MARFLHSKGAEPEVGEAKSFMSSYLAKIRVKMVLGFVMAFLGMAAFGVFSYRFFSYTEDKLFFLSQADQMLNTFLEVRRYEKNYLLYRHEEDYNLALDYLERFEQALREEDERLSARPGTGTMERVTGAGAAYRGALDRVHRLPFPEGAANPAREEAVRELRQAGKEIIAFAEELAARERAKVGSLLREYRPFLMLFLVSIGVVVAGMVYLLLTRMVKPLHLIEEATKQVAHGDFRPIDWPRGQDEISNLVAAFNRMVRELRENREQMIQHEKLTSLGTLTSGVAHELNNPLNNISTSCQILMEELGPAVEDYHGELLEVIENQVAKARDIVRSLLEFARPREFSPRREDLAAVAQEALTLMKGDIPAGVTVKVEVPEGLSLLMDKGQMVQALLNLIQNGVQAMPQGGLLALTARRDDQANEAVVEVSDSGQGIAPDLLPRIFDPFFTTKEVGRGTGLGLSITYGIIERHQGRITVESRSGQGSRFTLHLPLSQAGS